MASMYSRWRLCIEDGLAGAVAQNLDGMSKTFLCKDRNDILDIDIHRNIDIDINIDIDKNIDIDRNTDLNRNMETVI